MKMPELRTIAKNLGINSFGKSKVALVREIQRRQGHFDCFGTVIDYCDQQDCCFRAACFEASQRRRQSPEAP